MTPDDLVAEYLRVKDFVASETKRFTEHVLPHKTRMLEIENQLLNILNQAGHESARTEHGTYYKSTLLNVKIEDREMLLDYANDHWDTVGNDLLMISVKKEAVKQIMENNSGKPPPGVSTSFYTNLNIRRS